MTRMVRLYTLVTAIFLALPGLAGIAQAQADTGSIRGRVVAPDSEYGFHGARVTIKDTGRTVTTGRDGGFFMQRVPTGSHTLTVDYVGAGRKQIMVNVAAGRTAEVTAEIEGSIEEVLVYGQAAGQASALSRERDAFNNVEILSADAIGQFPDQNVAEALARVAGVSLQRDQGEGRFVSIRGMTPNFNTTTINGLRVPSPDESERAVPLDVVSSALVESVEVSKSITPDMDADAVGGNIEISTLTAFDLGNWASVTAVGSYDEVAEETSPRFELTGTRLFDVGDGRENLGIAASFNYYDREFAVHNIENGEWPLIEAPGGGEVRAPEATENRDYDLNRERIGGTLSFDYHPTDTSGYYLRGVYSSVEEFENELEHPHLFEDGTPVELSGSRGVFEDGVIERIGKSSEGTQEIFSLVAGGRNLIDLWTVEYEAGYSFANDDVPGTIEALFVGEGLAFGYDLGDPEKPRLFVEDPGSDPSLYELDEMEFENTFTEEEEYAVSIDVTRDLDLWGPSGSVSFGVQARLRDKMADNDLTLYDGFGGDFTLADFATMVDFPLGVFGPAVDNDAVRAFHNANRDQFEIDQEETEISNRSEDFDLEEDIYAGYAMGEMQFGDLSVITGLRFERTEVSQTGTRFTVDENVNDGEPVFEPLSTDTSYTDWFPNLQMLYRANERLELRASFTRSMARPGFEAAAARQAIEIEGSGEDEERVAEVGNPDLKPLYSWNYDLEVSYYPEGRLSVISAGVFYKQIEDFFITTDVAGQPPFADFDEVTQVINGSDADLYGLELKYVQQFGFLPPPWDGFLVSANYTYIDSEADVPFRDEAIRLPTQAENVANFSIGYEKYGISARLAALYRDEYLDEINDPEDPAQDRYADENLRWDCRAQYRVNGNFTVLFNIINITEEPDYYYIGQPRFNSQYDDIGRTIELGIRAQL